MAQPDAVAVQAEQVAAAYRQAWQRIIDAETAMMLDPRNATKVRRLEEMRRSIENEMDDLDATVGSRARGALSRTYKLGAAAEATSEAFSFAGIHTDAVNLLVDGLTNKLLAATQHVRDTTKDLIRRVARDENLQKVIEGKTAIQAGRDMQKVIEAHGIHAVRYSDGSRHGLAEYAQMQTRTTTALAYNEGTLNSATEQGTKWFEVLDGSDCGWNGHDDAQKADGMIVDRDDARSHLIAHPSCRRSFGGRPDLKNAKDLREARAFANRRAEKIRADAKVRDQLTAQRAPSPALPGGKHEQILRRHEQLAQVADVAVPIDNPIELVDRLPAQTVKPLDPAELKRLSDEFVESSRSVLAERGISGDDLARAVDDKLAEAAAREPLVSADVQAAARHAGAERLEGFDVRLKGRGSMERKLVTDTVEMGPGVTAFEAAEKIGDSLRYTVIAGPDDLVRVQHTVLGDLEDKGYQLVKGKNVWVDEGPYRGLNVQVRDPDGLLVEVQFHTPDSFAMKDRVNHGLYEEYRLPDVDRVRKAQLETQMIRNNSALDTPLGIDRSWVTGGDLDHDAFRPNVAPPPPRYDARAKFVERETRSGIHPTTEQQFAPNGVWDPKRARLHEDFLDEFYAKISAGVPADGEALMAGGLGGAGKTSTMKRHAGIDPDRFVTINADDVKEAMLKDPRFSFEQIADLTPMEHAALIHEESSQLAGRLAERAYAERKNVLWDMTMGSERSTLRKLDDLVEHGYEVDMIFIDIPVETSVNRAVKRWADGLDDHLKGEGLGGRFVPPHIIRDQFDAKWGSKNREVFERVQGRARKWSLWDNGVDGRAPLRIAEG